MRSRLRLLLGPLFLLGLTAAQQPPEGKRAVELRIGEIDSLSGVMAAQGTAVHEGVVYAVSEVNGRGGIRGHPVKLITRDDGGRPDEATTAALDLAARERVSALVGGYVDSVVGPVSFSSGRSTFDEHGDPLHYEVGIFQIQNGRHVLLYPRDRATGKVIRPKP